MAANTNRVTSGENYNKTQLCLSKARSRMIIHRDYDAHMNRFGHVLKYLKPNKKFTVLDVGCGDKQFAMSIYSNKHRGAIEAYHAVDLRDTTIEGLVGREPFPIVFHKQDVTKTLPAVEPDIVVNFEVIEHVSREKGLELLNRLQEVMVEKSILFLSTPCYDGKSQAGNHIHEWTYDELKVELEKRFELVDHWGTFMNTGIGPNKQMLEDFFGPETWSRLKEFFHSSTLSNMVAPLFPSKARNVMWKLKLKSA